MDTELPGILDAYLMLLHETAEYQQVSEIKTLISEAQSVLVRYWKRHQRSKKRCVVTVVGLTNAGKATLLNALLDGAPAPSPSLSLSREAPLVSAPIEFVYGDEMIVTALERVTRQTFRCDSYDGIRKKLGELAALGTSTKKIIVTSPQPLLSQGLILADTPSFSAAPQDAKNTNDENLKQYLNDEVAQIFWVVSAAKTVGINEMNSHDQFFAQIADDLIVTGCGDQDADERNNFRQRFSSLLFQAIRFHFVAGKPSSKPTTQGDSTLFEESGIDALRERILDIASPQGRDDALFDNLQRLSEDLASALNDFLRTNAKVSRVVWREDSWFRWESVLRDSVRKQKLNSILREAGEV